jgi:AcrR family transcriptional regulator
MGTTNSSKATSAQPSRSAAGEETRERIVETAERLFAEQGLSVSNRQIGEAAGQSNNSVVGYHFGAKADLIAAIVGRHTPDIEARRAAMIETLSDGPRLRPWLLALVKPVTDHLSSLGRKSFYARFLAQVTTDPTLRQLVVDRWIATETMRVVTEGVTERLPSLAPAVFAERSDMMRYLIVHALAERESALHARRPTARASWDEAADGIVDALLGLWRAPSSTRPEG